VADDRLCPVDSTELRRIERSGVHVDACPSCRGIWLDRGELDKILERSATHYSSKANYESDYKRYGYQEHDKHYDKNHPHKKKKSFLDDFFDF
jgi:uncharacterized protein